MEAMQCYRLRTILCDTAEMTRNTTSTLFLSRRASHFVPLHSPDSPDSFIFFAPDAGPARRGGEFTLRERLKGNRTDPDAQVCDKLGMPGCLNPNQFGNGIICTFRLP